MFKIVKKLADEEVHFDVKSVDKGHHNVTYRGVKAVRCPFDYLIYQMIISEVKPDLIIEIGTRKGGGAYYLADLLHNMGHGIVHTVDIVDDVETVVRKHPRINLFTDGWANYDITLAKDHEKIIVIEDASHLYKDTMGVLNKFHSLVNIGSYFIIEDGIINELGLEKEYNGGPLKAIREFLPKHPEFVVDKKWCDMFGKNATFNVNGYLKKIK
ncbi:CmcI family methyltransferase [Aequorivita viscosa]|nr:CmcI family methyltransferase [Aequorivita viscosa]